MEKIDTTSELTNPQFVKPLLIKYTQKGIQKTWEAVLSHDSVAILLYHTEKKSFVLVKQLRPAVLYSNKVDGKMYELCAGIVDKKLTHKEIAKEEILEECGYNVPLEKIEKVSSFYTSVGISGAKQTLYYASIDDTMKETEGGGLEEEDIEVVYLPIIDAKAFMFDEKYQKTPGMIMAFYWFFDTQLETS